MHEYGNRLHFSEKMQDHVLARSPADNCANSKAQRIYLAKAQSTEINQNIDKPRVACNLHCVSAVQVAYPPANF